ncbi:MAG: BamA/TamA family outer membrane protein, partial [Pseudomonadota bacterium]
MPVEFRLFSAALAALTCVVGAASADVVVRVDTNDAALAGQLEDIARSNASAPETRFEAMRQARQAAIVLDDYLNSKGYFRAETSPSVDGADAPISVVTVRLGPQFRIGRVLTEIDGRELAPGVREDVDAAVDLSVGEIAIPDDIFRAERSGREALQAAGYAFAEILERDVVGDADAGEVDVRLKLETGPRVRFGKTYYDDGVRTRRVYLERLIPYEEGDVYSPAAIAAFNKRLIETRLYRVATARIVDEPSGLTDDGDEIRDVRVSFVERDRYTISAGASFSTSEGAGVSGAWTRRNATRRGDILDVRGVFAEQERTLGADWRFPNAFGYGRGLSVDGQFGREETDAFDRDFVVVGAVLDVERSPHIHYAFGVANEFSRETDDMETRDLHIVSTSAALGADWSDSLLEPTQGWRGDIRGEPGWVLGEENTPYFMTLGGAAIYRGFGEERDWVAAFRGRAGSLIGAGTLELPASRRFFAGGGGSARGYAYQSIGPKDDLGDPRGGRGLL